MSIGKQIELGRIAKGYNQTQMGKLCGWSQVTQSKYENDKQLPSGKRLEKIAEVLGKEWKLV